MHKNDSAEGAFKCGKEQDKNEKKSETVHSKKFVRYFERGDDIDKPVDTECDGLRGAG